VVAFFSKKRSSSVVSPLVRRRVLPPRRARAREKTHLAPSTDRSSFTARERFRLRAGADPSFFKKNSRQRGTTPRRPKSNQIKSNRESNPSVHAVRIARYPPRARRRLHRAHARRRRRPSSVVVPVPVRARDTPVVATHTAAPAPSFRQLRCGDDVMMMVKIEKESRVVNRHFYPIRCILFKTHTCTHLVYSSLVYSQYVY